MDKRAVVVVTTLAALAGVTAAATAGTPQHQGAGAPSPEPTAPGAAEAWSPGAVQAWSPAAENAAVPQRAAVTAPAAAGEGLLAGAATTRLTLRRLAWWQRPSSAAATVVTSLPPRTGTGVCGDTRWGVLRPDPIAAARCGQRMWSNYQLSHQQSWLDQATVQAEWLAANARVSDGAWYFPRVTPMVSNGRRRTALTWSGLTQGEALSLFSQLAEVTGQPRWQQAATATFRSLLAAPRPGRPATSGRAGATLWLDTTGDAGRRFTGHLRATAAAYDYWRATGDRQALRLLRAALATLLTGPAPAQVTTAQVAAVQRWATATGEDAFVRAAARLWLTSPVAVTDGTVLLRGAVTGYVLRGGRPVRSHIVKAGGGQQVRLGWRGRVPGSAAIWLRVRSGPLRGQFIAEQPATAYVAGTLTALTLTPPTALAAGRPRVDTVAVVDGHRLGRVAIGQSGAGNWTALG